MLTAVVPLLIEYATFEGPAGTSASACLGDRRAVLLVLIAVCLVLGRSAILGPVNDDEEILRYVSFPQAPEV